MRKLILLLLCVWAFTSCKTTRKMNGQSDSVIFSLRKTECKGKCPVYLMEIYNSGKVIFEGTKNTDKIGKYEKELTGHVVENLIADFEKADFFDFKKEYTALVRDLPSTYIGFYYAGRMKLIRDYHGAPKELKELEEKLIKIIFGKSNRTSLINRIVPIWANVKFDFLELFGISLM